MNMIDISNLDKLTKEQKEQFAGLLDQFPSLGSKMDASRELNTPTKLETISFKEGFDKMSEELDYSNFIAPMPTEVQKVSKRVEDLPTLKVDPNKNSFSSIEQETEKTEENQKDVEEKTNQQRIQAAIKSGQAPEIAKFETVGKIHPVLKKLRATMGLRSIQPPIVVALGGVNYSMQSLDRSSITKATLLALQTTDNNLLYQTNLEVAIIAHAIVAIDNVPLVDIFSIPTEEIVEDESKPISAARREDLAIRSMYTELLCSPNELVESLSTFYQQEFPALNLIGAGKFKYVCPVSECLQSRIIEENATCYCPVHGEKMAREDQLPNPF